MEEVNKDGDEVIITMIEGWRGEINIVCEERRALTRPGSGDVIVNYHPLTHLHHTHTHTPTHTHTHTHTHTQRPWIDICLLDC